GSIKERAGVLEDHARDERAGAGGGRGQGGQGRGQGARGRAGGPRRRARRALMAVSAPTRTRTEILISGFGGQGVIRMGQILGLCAINQGHRVTMLKSHGTETRGGYV